MFRCFVAAGRTNEVSIPFCRAVDYMDYARQEHDIETNQTNNNRFNQSYFEKVTNGHYLEEPQILIYN